MRLVEHEQRRLGQQRARKRQPLPLTLGEGGGRARGRLREAGRRKRALGDVVAEPVEARAEDEVLARAQPAPEQRPVSRVGDAGAFRRRELAAFAPVDEHVPCARPQQTRDAAQQRRLAAPVRPEQAERAAGLEHALHAGEHDAAAVRVPDAAQLEARRGHERATSSDTVPKYSRAMTPLTLRNAMSTRERSSGETSCCS